MPHEIIDGTMQDRTGRWVSYVYGLNGGELMFVAFFNASAYSEPTIEVFEYK